MLLRPFYTRMICLHESLLLLAQRKIWYVLALVAATRRRLNHTLARVAHRGDTGKGIGFLFLIGEAAVSS